MGRWVAWAGTMALTLGSPVGWGAQPARPPVAVVVDTDIGSDVDDAFALGLVLASPELALRGVTSVGGAAEDRAWLAGRLLTHADRKDVPVAWGRPPQPDYGLDWQIQYRRHPAVVWNRTARPIPQPAEDFLLERLRAEPGLVLLALGPLTNIARVLERDPQARERIGRIVLMGGSLHVGYDGRPPSVAEWNFRSDPAAARRVLSSGVPITMVPLDVTAGLALDEPRRSRIFSAHTPLAFQLHALYELWGKETPVLHDPLAVALAIDERLASFEEMALEVDEDGKVRSAAGRPSARVATGVQSEKFFDWLVDRLSAGTPVLPDPPVNRAAIIDPGRLPERVHLVEDYETDIEQRWWLAGVLETKDVPAGSQRACRAVLTQDFDGQMGNRQATYRAVIFNPVPGPPMGPRTRLAFRYKLRGTDTIRVQLFSLSKGYHRYLSVGSLPQDQWTSAALDMTQMRRPDGSGGPLGQDERIDDIQFYIDPRGELLIDDILLYEAAPEHQSRSFPQRVVFTGWFDTGKQGKEWPGQFDVVPHEPPRTWKAARSVPSDRPGVAHLRIGLRGPRPLAERLRLRFAYSLAGGSAVRIDLVDSTTGLQYPSTPAQWEQGGWSEASVEFTIPQGATARADELRFIIDPGATLLIDDVLLYQAEP